jgi:hypothetical protein
MPKLMTRPLILKTFMLVLAVDTGIWPFNLSKVINRIKPIIHDSIVVHSFTPLELTIPFPASVLTRSPLNTEAGALSKCGFIR